MSEYQYYEFQAIDRPLTAEQMNELRAYSTRARITSTSFVNEYHFGSFKGDEDAWMVNYFDAFLYVSNWGTQAIKLRIPSRFLPLETAKQYCGGDHCEVWEKAGSVVLSICAEQEPEYADDVEGDGLLSGMVAVRTELARGDLRALYLFWLLQVQAEELTDDVVEPPLPPGLKQLSASLQAICAFLRVDEDLLSVAADLSQPLNDYAVDHSLALNWLRELPQDEKDDVLARVLVDGDLSAAAELLQQFVQHRSVETAGQPQPTRRTVGQLRKMAEARRVERERFEAEKHAEEQDRREKEAAAARQRYLDALVGREDDLWNKVETLIETTQSKSYDLAIQHLLDLKDLAARSRSSDFARRVERLHASHSRKASFIDRLGKAGLNHVGLSRFQAEHDQLG